MVIENPPPAPDELPQYIIDGLHRQDKQSLELIEQYAIELRETIEEREAESIPEEELGGEDETIEDIDRSDDGTVVIKKSTVRERL